MISNDFSDTIFESIPIKFSDFFEKFQELSIDYDVESGGKFLTDYNFNPAYNFFNPLHKQPSSDCEIRLIPADDFMETFNETQNKTALVFSEN